MLLRYSLLPLFILLLIPITSLAREVQGEDVASRTPVIESQREAVIKTRLELEQDQEINNRRVANERALAQQKELLHSVIDALMRYAEEMKQRAALLSDATLRQRLETVSDLHLSRLQAWKDRVNTAETILDTKRIAEELRQFRREMDQSKNQAELSWRRAMLLSHVQLFEERIVVRAEARLRLIEQALSRTGELLEQEQLLFDTAQQELQGVRSLIDALQQEILLSEQLSKQEIVTVRHKLYEIRQKTKLIYQHFRSIAETVQK